MRCSPVGRSFNEESLDYYPASGHRDISLGVFGRFG